MKKSILLATLIFTVTITNAQMPGDLDTSFGISGYTLTDPYQNTSEVYQDMIILSNDKIIKVGYRGTAGSKDALVAKFQANGSPDSTFGNNGFTAIDLSLGADEDARAIVELPNGKLLITGQIENISSKDGYIARLNTDGSVDNSFGTSNGHTKFNLGDNTNAQGNNILLSGSEIFVGGKARINGQSDIFIVNLTQGGGIDVSFSSSGFATMDIRGEDDELNALDATSNGSFIFGGVADSAGVRLGYIASLSQFGTPTTFGSNGRFTFDLGSGFNEVNDLYVDANDKIVLTGDQGNYPNIDGFIQRLDASGAPDNTFGTGGSIPSDPGASTALFLRRIMETTNGNILALGNFAGASNDMYAFMVTSTGSPNANFGGNGDVNIPFSINTNTVNTTSGGLQSNGDIVMGGYLTSQDFVGSNLFMVRLHPYLNNTSIENKSKHHNIAIYPSPIRSNFKVSLDNFNRMELISINGSILTSWTPQRNYSIPQHITSGLYFIRIYSDETSTTRKVLIDQ